MSDGHGDIHMYMPHISDEHGDIHMYIMYVGMYACIHEEIYICMYVCVCVCVYEKRGNLQEERNNKVGKVSQVPSRLPPHYVYMSYNI
jgi:hypothetical protein